MAGIPSNVSVDLIRALIDNLSGAPDGWEQLSMVLSFDTRRFTGTYGYAYSPDGTISAVASRPSAVRDAAQAYTESYTGPDNAFPVKLLLQFDQPSGRYKVEFEETDTNRWKVTPANIETIQQDLRPVFDESGDSEKPELVFSRENGWIPQVIRIDGSLYLAFGAGADANHDPRPFKFPITDAHLEVIKNDLTRHFLLWSAILPLCDDAGTDRQLNDEAAIALLDPILFGTETEVEAFLKEIAWQKETLIAHHADTKLLLDGKLFDALKTVTQQADWSIVDEFRANRDRERRGIVLSELDTAVLKYTGQYIHRSGLAFRKPEAVDATLLPQVLDIIATADRAASGVEFSRETKDPEFYLIRKKEWKDLSTKITTALETAYPSLAEDVLASVSYLICSEAFKRSKADK